MRAIHKEGHFVPLNVFTIENFNKVVHFGVQGKSMYIWVERDMEEKLVRSAQFLIVSTGAQYEPYWKHIQTLIHPNGTVWHLLEEMDPILELAKI